MNRIIKIERCAFFTPAPCVLNGGVRIVYSDQHIAAIGQLRGRGDHEVVKPDNEIALGVEYQCKCVVAIIWDIWCLEI
jgi:hypothetical protein